MTEPKNYDAMSSEEIDNEILLIQKELNTQIENLGIVQVEMTNLKRKELEAKEVIRRTKQDIRNLENVYKWRALKREKGL